MHIYNILESDYIKTEVLPMVLRRGADVDALTREGTSCLHFACRLKHTSSAMARDLLEAGSNPNVGLTKTGITALHYAARERRGGHRD